MIRYTFILLIPIFFIACKNKNGMSGGVIKPEKMQAIMWDFFQADVYTQQYIKRDSLKDPIFENAQLQQKIFFLHGVNKDDFYNSYRYYADTPDQMKAILDSINARSERKRSKMMMNKYSGGKHVAE
jgi:Domain of unknown function (DUF4296)